MAMTSEGILAYGYALGGAGGCWNLNDAEKYGRMPDEAWPAWCHESDEDPAEHFIGRAEERIRAVVANFIDTDLRADGYSDRQRAADTLVGVKLHHHGHADLGAYQLVTYRQAVEWSETAILDPAELARLPIEGDWDAKLAAAIAALGINPTQERPGWLLAASYA